MDNWDYTDSKHVVVDRLGVTTDLYGVRINIGIADPQAQTVACAIIAHMSPQNAKALHMILERQLKDYEEKFGVIPRDAALEHNLGLHEG